MEEFNFAMEQLAIRNADMLKKCQLAGIPTEPTQDVQTLIAVAGMMDYRDGWRPDPARPGQLKLETRYDAATGQNVPAVLPDLKTAIKMRRLNEGYYKKGIDQAYQRGAQNLAAAMAKRDPTVAELNDPSLIGTSGNATTEWALSVLEADNDAEAMRRYRAGDTSMVDEINKARAALGMKPIVFSQ